MNRLRVGEKYLCGLFIVVVFMGLEEQRGREFKSSYGGKRASRKDGGRFLLGGSP